MPGCKESSNGFTQPSAAHQIIHFYDTEVKGIDNVTASDTSSYMANYNAHKPGITEQEMIDAYTEWANNYDQDLCPGRYNGPEIAADFMAKHFELMRERENVRILDVAAGTGRVGYELSKRGFKKIDALEPSSGMMKILEGRNIYTNQYETTIGHKRSLSMLCPKLYDALVVAGGMGEGHIPANAILEMLRLVKSGGVIIIVMREEYLTYVSEYINKLEPLMEELQKKGFWTKVSRTVVPEYSFNKNGVVFVYSVTSDAFPQ